MGKKGKKIRSDKKKAAKASLKARNRAYYDSLRDSGNNSKRFKRKSKKAGSLGNKGKHLIHNCGNVGCLKCNPNERRSVKILNINESRALIKKMNSRVGQKPHIHPGRNTPKLQRKNLAS